MYNYILMFIFGLGLLISWVGWGWIVSRIILRNETEDLGWLASIGLSFTVVVGGILNIFAIISKASLLLFLMVGFLGFLIYAVKNYQVFLSGISFFLQNSKNNKPAFAIILLLFFLIVLKYAVSISPGEFHEWDDYMYYFLFPVKMMQTGTLGQEPFSTTRLMNGLGGQYFLDTFVLLFGDEKNFHLLDKGVGFLVFLLAILGFLQELKIAKKYSILILLIAVLIPTYQSNITATYTGLALCTILIRIFYDNKRSGFGYLVFFALVIAATCSLKNTFTPICGLFVVAFFILRLKNIQAWRKVVVDAASFLLILFLFLLPWMISLYVSSGTLYYPLLGNGFYRLYPTFELSFAVLPRSLRGLSRAFHTIVFFVFAVLIILPYIDKYFRQAIQREDLYLGVISVLALGFIAYALPEAHVYRYSFSFVFPVVLVLISRFIIATESKGPLTMSSTYSFLMVVLMGMLAGSGLTSFSEKGFRYLFVSGHQILFGIKGQKIVLAEEVENYKNMQDAVPAKEKILVQVDKSFMFDFNRNVIYLLDCADGASLPPGMPVFMGPEPIAKYLIDHSIRYLAYSYQGVASTLKENEYSLHASDPYNRACYEHGVDFNDNLKMLGETRKRVYDDHKIFVLDLAVKQK